METYRLNSRLVDVDREYVIQTSHDANAGMVSSQLFVNGRPADTVTRPHPVEIDPDDVVSLIEHLHGEQKREIELLLQWYRRLIENGEADRLVRLGYAFLYRGFCQESLDLFNHALELDSEYHQGYNALCLARLFLGDTEGAVEAGHQAVIKRPNFADYRNNYGEALMAGGRFDEAVEEFSRAIQINLYYADAHLNVAVALLSKQIEAPSDNNAAALLDAVRDAVRKASTVYPEYSRAAIEQALGELDSADLDGARETILRIRSAKKEKQRHDYASYYMKFVMATSAMSERMLADRIAYLKQELTRNPSYVDLHAELGRCYFEQGRMSWQRGMEQYQKALEMHSALPGIQEAIDAARAEYESLCAVLSKIVQKG